VGTSAQATAVNTTAVGRIANASAAGAVAIGDAGVASGVNSTALGTGANATFANSVALGAGTATTAINQVNVGGRTISGVAAGVAATDAVNVSQLTITNNAVAAIQAVNTTQNSQIAGLQAADTLAQSELDDLGFDLRRDRKDARAGTASALAAAALPQAMGEGRTMIAGGIGTYRGRGALAIGASHRVSGGNAVFKVGVTYDSEEHVGANGGFGFEF
jgi:autotransporter adhesin